MNHRSSIFDTDISYIDRDNIKNKNNIDPNFNINDIPRIMYELNMIQNHPEKTKKLSKKSRQMCLNIQQLTNFKTI